VVGRKKDGPTTSAGENERSGGAHPPVAEKKGNSRPRISGRSKTIGCAAPPAADRETRGWGEAGKRRRGGGDRGRTFLRVPPSPCLRVPAEGRGDSTSRNPQEGSLQPRLQKVKLTPGEIRRAAPRDGCVLRTPTAGFSVRKHLGPWCDERCLPRRASQHHTDRQFRSRRASPAAEASSGCQY
jgi:hypothetical protein